MVVFKNDPETINHVDYSGASIWDHIQKLYSVSRRSPIFFGTMAPPQRKLGLKGPEVTAIGYGCMGLSAFYGAPKPDEERLAFLDHVYQSGQRNWDTADIYGDSEVLLGK